MTDSKTAGVDLTQPLRFIARAGRFKFHAIPEDVTVIDGRTVVRQNTFMATFQRGALEKHELELATAHWGKKLVTAGRREGEPVEARFSTYDTGQIDDLELRAKVNASFLKARALGNEFIRSEKPRTPAPFYGYDQLPSETVAAFAWVAGFRGAKAKQVYDYESENQNRREVLLALAGASQDVQPAGVPELMATLAGQPAQSGPAPGATEEAYVKAAPELSHAEQAAADLAGSWEPAPQGDPLPLDAEQAAYQSPVADAIASAEPVTEDPFGDEGDDEDESTADQDEEEADVPA